MSCVSKVTHTHTHTYIWCLLHKAGCEWGCVFSSHERLNVCLSLLPARLVPLSSAVASLFQSVRVCTLRLFLSHVHACRKTKIYTLWKCIIFVILTMVWHLSNQSKQPVQRTDLFRLFRPTLWSTPWHKLLQHGVSPSTFIFLMVFCVCLWERERNTTTVSGSLWKPWKGPMFKMIMVYLAEGDKERKGELSGCRFFICFSMFFNLVLVCEKAVK